MKPKEFLMIPGPTPVPDQVLEAVARHPIGHRTSGFSSELNQAVSGLKWLGQTKNDVFVLTASGTGAMEAAIANTVNAGDKVLSLVCGVFGERLAKICEAYGAQVERITAEAGSAISVNAVKKHLQADSQKTIKAVTITHNETSTGVLNNLQAIAQAVQDHGALSIVDAVTSFGACPLPIDEWGIDVLITGSQKALMLPPGLSFVFVSAKAWAVNKACKTARFYFDWRQYKKSMDANTTPFTPNVSLVAGLSQSVKMLKAEGLEAVFARHQLMKSMLRAGIESMGLKPYVDEDCASPSITAIYPPTNISVDAIRKGLKEQFSILVADGQDELKGKIFRIGHMGYVFPRDILMTLAALEAVLQDLGYDLPEKGRSAKAAEAVLAKKL